MGHHLCQGTLLFPHFLLGHTVTHTLPSSVLQLEVLRAKQPNGSHLCSKVQSILLTRSSNHPKVSTERPATPLARLALDNRRSRRSRGSGRSRGGVICKRWPSQYPSIDPKYHEKVSAIFCNLFQADSQDTSSSINMFLVKKQTQNTDTLITKQK